MRLSGVPCSGFKDLDCVAFTRAGIVEAVDAALDGCEWPEAMSIAFARWSGGHFEYKRNADADEDDADDDDWSDVACLDLTPITAERNKRWRIVEELPNEVHALLPPRLGHTRPLWGDVRPILVEDGDAFVALFCELEDDDRDDGVGFHHNMRTLIDAMLAKQLYTLEVVEGERLLRPSEDPIFTRDAFLTLPCLAVVNRGVCSIIWVHSRARRLGLGRTMLIELNVNCAEKPLSQSLGFFKACEVDVA